MDGQKDVGQKDGRTEDGLTGRMDRTDGQKDGWTDRRTGRMN